MHSAFLLFEKNINAARESGVCYDYLSSSIKVADSFEDLLRSQIVYSVSAFDKLMHDLVHIGMMEIFKGERPATPKYLAEPIPIKFHKSILEESIFPKEVIFAQAINEKLKFLSFQDPAKVSDGLSYIWMEKNKWKFICVSMNISEKDAKTTLKLIVNKRNSIVHESDINPATKEKIVINKNESDEITDFVFECGRSIYNLVAIKM